jgi:hypothetical protein
VNDIVIFAEVGDEVVHWVATLAGWDPGGEWFSLDIGIKLGVEPVIWSQVPVSVLSFLLMHMVK